MSERAGTDRTSLGHVPDGRWEFDDEVTRVFDDMLERSIPQLQTMRRTVYEAGRNYASRDEREPPWLIDLGTSRGGAIAPFVEEGWGAFGYEVSEPMRNAALRRFEGTPNITIVGDDLRTVNTLGLGGRADLVLAVLTLVFIPINHRQRIIQMAYESLKDGGAMIVVEKVLGRGARIDKLMVDLYHDSKEAAGYTREEIDRKALALEGVQVPVTAAWNEELLRNAGFAEVDCFWRWCNFAGWIAVK